MNLCLACRNVHADPLGGLSRATRDLAEALGAQGHRVHLLTDLPAHPPLELEGVEVRRVVALPGSGPFAAPAPGTAQHNLLHAAAVHREVRRIHEHEARVDAVLAPLWRSEGAVCLLDDAFPTVVSCMTSLRTLTEIDEPWLQLPDIDARLGLERAALRRSPYLHGLTRSVLDKTIDDYQLSPARAVVIGRGLRDRCLTTADQPVPNPNPDSLDVLFVGRIERRKGVDTLLVAAERLVDAGIELRLTLAGPEADPALQEQLKRDAAGHSGLGQRVRFAGVVPDRELDRLYREADVVCVPSRYESHGIVVIEAMMFAKAIVTGSGGGLTEVVRDGREALVADADDPAAVAAALRRLAEDHELRRRLGAAARQGFEARFERDRVAARMAELLGEAAVAHPRTELAAEDLAPRLAALITEALGVETAQALPQAAALLDPERYGPLADVRTMVVPPGRDGAGSAPTRTRVAAVLVARDRPELLTRALDSLHDESTSQIVVIDDRSAPSTARALSRDCGRRQAARLYRTEHNLGHAGGRQLGVELTDRELLLFLDDDAELMPGALEQLVAELDAHPDAGAVAATVVGPDGTVQHSGGTFELTDELATFSLIGAGLTIADDELPASGHADWVPGTAVVIRRGLLTDFQLDAGMTPYYEDNDWCLRVAAERPGAFRRCREAIVVHHQRPQPLGDRTRPGRELTAALLSAHAGFYERHGRLLCPWLFDVAPELRDEQGTRDLPAARLLLELVSLLGADWLSAAWVDGRLAPILERSTLHDQLRRYESALRQSQAQGAQSEAEITRLRQALVAQDEALSFLHARHETLTRVEAGGWWRLRGRLLPLLRVAGRLRAETNDGTEALALAPARRTQASREPAGPGQDS